MIIDSIDNYEDFKYSWHQYKYVDGRLVHILNWKEIVDDFNVLESFHHGFYFYEKTSYYWIGNILI